MKTHELKIWPQFFEAVKSGVKTFELRVNDREFQTGDMVRLVEWDPEMRVTDLEGGPPYKVKLGGSTGSYLDFFIGYILPVDGTRVVFSLVKELDK